MSTIDKYVAITAFVLFALWCNGWYINYKVGVAIAETRAETILQTKDTIYNNQRKQQRLYGNILVGDTMYYCRKRYQLTGDSK